MTWKMISLGTCSECRNTDYTERKIGVRELLDRRELCKKCQYKEVNFIK